MSCAIKDTDALAPLRWLIGHWESVDAEVFFPANTNMEGFKYTETVEFIPMKENVLQYKSQTSHPIKKIPLHYESGFIHVFPDANRVAFMGAHFFGCIELSEGDIEEEALTLESTTFAHAPFLKPSSTITKIIRNFKASGEELTSNISIATEIQPLQEHLVVRYKRSS